MIYWNLLQIHRVVLLLDSHGYWKTPLGVFFLLNSNQLGEFGIRAELWTWILAKVGWLCSLRFVGSFSRLPLTVGIVKVSGLARSMN